MGRNDQYEGLNSSPAADAQSIEKQLGEPSNDTHAPADVLHLAELVPIVRERLRVGPDFPDDAILASLKAIAQRTAPRDRWSTAFQSNLGLWLSASCREHEHNLAEDLTTLLNLMPKPRL